MGRRLVDSPSPYLRQHAGNPVDWYPWGDEAFSAARELDRPIFLSIGYSACHWCHVMAHESFEDATLAALMNEAFVNVKVDREELPQVDGTYMTFVQMFTGRGGWPTSVFLTPDGRPFFGGTYWPREDFGGHPGFATICRRVRDVWASNRRDLEDTAEQYSVALGEALAATSLSLPGSVVSVEQVLEGMRARFDGVHGGFGGAPKFPPHSELELLQLVGERGMAVGTLEGMARGGIYDHVGGGFHRYSTDARWLVPHFEKMLYDNALLLDRYAAARGFGRVVERTVGWLKREMTSPEGAFYSALDADSEGVEGKFYVWSWEELQGLPDAETFCKAFGCKPKGNFHDEASGRLTGLNILHGGGAGAFDGQLGELLALRAKRVRPGLDDKCLVGWNGLAIAGLVRAGERELAARAADAILGAGAELPRMLVGGKAHGSGFLEDYAYFVYGLCALGGDYLAEARRLGNLMIDLFADPVEGGFFSTSPGQEVFTRTKPMFDEPLPSANAMACRCLTKLGWYAQARFHLERIGGWTSRAPHGTEALLVALLEAREPVSSGVSAVIEGDRVVVEVPSGYHLEGVEVSFNGAKGAVSGLELEGFSGDRVFLRYQLCSDRECVAVADLEVLRR